MHQSIQAFYDRKYTGGVEIPRTSKQYTVDCVPDGTRLDIRDVGCGSGANSACFRTGGCFWHLSRKSSILNALFADCLIVVMEKP